MQVLHDRCAGLDVHKDSVVACALVGSQEPQVERFGTTTAELLRLSDWLAGRGVTHVGVTHVAMESTGVYWKPVWNLLEDRFELMLVNPRHFHNVPGRKTDVADGTPAIHRRGPRQWLAELLRFGLLRGSFVPTRDERELREPTRMRSSLVTERARVANRIQKVLEGANVKLGSVVADVLGKSGRDILAALVERPQVPPQELAQLARGVLRAKIPQLAAALTSHTLREHHRFLLAQLLDQVEHLEKQVDAFERRIDEVMRPFAQNLAKLDEVPGINRRAAQTIAAEIGLNMGRFKTGSTRPVGRACARATMRRPASARPDVDATATAGSARCWRSAPGPPPAPNAATSTPCTIASSTAAGTSAP